MSVFIETTVLQDDLAKREALVLQTLQVSHSLAGQMVRSYEIIQMLPDEELIAVLNAETQTSLDTQALLDALAVAINALLDAAVEDRPELASTLLYRVPVGFGRAEYDDTIPGFKITPPPPEP